MVQIYGGIKFYFDFHFPLKIVEFLWKLLLGNPHNPRPVDPATREWFSQPRVGTNPTTEVVRTVFKLPLSISEISTEVLRQPCTVEFWYLDRSNNWRQIMDLARTPLKFNVSRSDERSFYKYSTRIYPVVAKQVQIRLTRLNDRSLEGIAFPVGLRNTLMRRNVYDRESGRAYFEDELDVFGNVISKYIKDWAPVKAADNDAHTYWKSAPQPDPAAVVALYLDVRGGEGVPKPIDRVYLDPVYTGSQHLNMYYSNDDTVGPLKLNPVDILPETDENTEWRIDRGRWDTTPATGVHDDSLYRWDLPMGPLIDQDAWIGIRWQPDFDPASGPAQVPILFKVTNPVEPAFGLEISYDVGSRNFVLTFDDGTDERNYSVSATTPWKEGDTLSIVVAWDYDPDTVHFEVRNESGEVLYLDDQVASSLPSLVSIGGLCEIRNFRGLLTSLVIKLESHTMGSDSFLANPVYYVNPDPVVADSQGNIPSTTLDNAIFLACWDSQQNPCGGTSDTFYEDKEWTPIWRNYVVQKGMMHLPQSISMKFLKLEFTNLSEEPYPVYESGIETRYKVFPISVQQQSSVGPRLYTGTIGFLGLSSFIGVNAAKTVNWLDPNSVSRAVGTLFEPAYPPIYISSGPGYVTETLPNQGSVIPETITRAEASSQFVYRRTTIRPNVLAENAYTMAIKSPVWTQSMGSDFDVPWEDIAASNPTASTPVYSAGAPALRGSDWWVFPGQMLKLPAAVMQRITRTAVITERKLTLERRVRFAATSVHRYDYRTVKRDVALAYFAGVREVVPYISTYIPGEDQSFFEFGTYDRDQWVFNNIHQLPEGPITTQAGVYRVPNPSFDNGLNNWGIESGDWGADFSLNSGHWNLGSAVATATTVESSLLSAEVFVIGDDEVVGSCWVKWDSVTATAASRPIQLHVDAYDDANHLVNTYLLTDYGSSDWAGNEGDWVRLTGTATIPSGASAVRVRLVVTTAMTAGRVWFDNIGLVDADTVSGAAFSTIQKSFSTFSSFAKAIVDFRDSGLVRSDSMWADILTTNQNVSDIALAPYVETLPSTMPGGMWNDFAKAWGGDDIEWGSKVATVSVTLDGDRRYQGKRVLKFHRAEGAGEAGMLVKQWTNFAPLALARIGAVVYKPYANDNLVTLRLINVDGVGGPENDGVIHKEDFTVPVGRWFACRSQFAEIPEGAEQEYEVQITMIGDDEDTLYVNDLYTELALIRYFLTMGGLGSETHHEVTDLRYSDNRTIATVTAPVSEMSVQASIMSPNAYAHGCRITPTYLK